MNKPNILIVEDDPMWRDVVKEMLETEDYEVTEAENYETALTAIKKPDLQLVLMDLRLTEADEKDRKGLTLLSYIGMFNPCARAIVITAYADFQSEAKRASYGVFDYLLKQELEQASFLRIVQDAIQEAFDCQAGVKERPAYPEYL